jgi:hypothetical protein
MLKYTDAPSRARAAVPIAVGVAALAAGAACADARPPPRSEYEERTLIVPAAATPAAGPTTTGAPSAPAEPPIDERVMERLDQMGAFLREQRAFIVKGESATDEILSDTGQKIQLTASYELWVRRPDRMRVKVSSDRKERELFYDGSTFTVFGRRNGYYATVDAPPTIAEVIDTVESRYGIEIPLVDLFYWGTEQSGAEAVKRASAIGPGRIRGVACDHFALRQDDVDWQVWIEQGKRPLPRKLVITTTSEPQQPQHEVVLDWTLDAKLADPMFKFVPPEGAHKIPLQPIGQPPG